MILLQIISILFALVVAGRDAPAVSRFEYSGVSQKELKAFHGFNWVLKFIFCALAAWNYYPDFETILFAGLFSFLWIYLVFDPALNRMRTPKRLWHYMGLNDADGRFWNGIAGKNSGKVKAVILIISIIILNVTQCYQTARSYQSTANLETRTILP